MLRRWTRLLPVLLALLLLIGLRPAHCTTTTYLYNDSHIVYLGPWANQSGSGHNFCAALANSGWEMSYGFTGTQTTIQIFVTTAGAFQFSVDGGSFTTSNVTTLSAFTTYTVVTGLTDAAHTLTIKHVGSFTFDLAQDATITVTGAAPSLSLVSGYGPVYNLDRSTTDFLGRAGISSVSNMEGGWISSTTNASFIPAASYTQATTGGNNWSDADEDFYATSPAISAYMFCNSTSARLVVDGVPLTPVALPSTGWQVVSLATGLDSSHQHRYRIYISMPPINMMQIMTPGGTINTSTGPPARSLWLFFGDSIVSSTTGTVGQSISGLSDTMLGWPSRICQANNVICMNRGIGGTTAFNTTGQPGSSGTAAVTTQSGQARAATDLAGISPAPSRLFMAYGINDFMNVSGMSPAETTAQFQTAQTSILTSAVAAVPKTCSIIVFGIWPRTGHTQSEYVAWNAATLAAIAAVGAPNVTYIDPYTWYAPLTDTIDGLHPNAFGCLEIQIQLQTYLNTFGRGRARASSMPAEPALTFKTTNRRSYREAA